YQNVGIAADAQQSVHEMGTGGNDVLCFVSSRTVLQPCIRVLLDGGNGDDQLQTEFRDSDIRGQFTVAQRGGNGADEIGMIINYRVESGASFVAVQEGGNGDDRLRTDVRDSDIGGQSAVAQRGGNGADEIGMIINYRVESGASFVAVQEGGNGDDRLRTDV